MDGKAKKKLSKKIWIPIVVLVLLAVLFVPVSGVMDDGGTRVYSALTYKVIKWHRLLGMGEDCYDATRVYVFPNNFKSVSDLWEEEGVDESAYRKQEEESFLARVLELSVVSALVEPLEGEEERKSSDKIRFSVRGLEGMEGTMAEPGDIVEIFYDGVIRESYPAGIEATQWMLSGKTREQVYGGQWLDKTTAEGYDSEVFDFTDLQITKIYTDCFFARPLPIGQAIKFNGTLSDEWCIGDRIVCTYENACYDSKTWRREVDLLTIEVSDWEPEPGESGGYMLYKPVIYLYPEEETKIFVELSLKEGDLTCTYPAYEDGWTVTALPDGTLTDAKGQTYNYLYWEGETGTEFDFSDGFCVKGEDTAVFLETALAKLGLTRREANEFIVYWLPMMEQNPYNIISFQTEKYTEAAKLTVSPEPDTLLRVFMAWKAAEEYTELTGQKLTAPERTGFTVVEWGGTEVK